MKLRWKSEAKMSQGGNESSSRGGQRGFMKIAARWKIVGRQDGEVFYTSRTLPNEEELASARAQTDGTRKRLPSGTLLSVDCAMWAVSGDLPSAVRDVRSLRTLRRR